MKRRAKISRTTAETDITISLCLDGSGKCSLQTPVAFLNHMLELTARHGLFDLQLTATGDTAIDLHHTVEDIGICLGQAIGTALGSKEQITRFGEATVPMDEALARVVIDLSGRPLLVFASPPLRGKTGGFDLDLAEEFFQALVNHAHLTLHIDVFRGRNAHHILEAVFKAFGRALDRATRIDTRSPGIPSTKGTL
ncbi:MAG: imidazoleglycerol-phosphate dehydratase HisB [Desulfobacterota bacterium]|nr:imidazoleglycerol-phosphate dehydratase HisB [Thermodesulfobacteriota bacterium]